MYCIANILCRVVIKLQISTAITFLKGLSRNSILLKEILPQKCLWQFLQVVPRFVKFLFWKKVFKWRNISFFRNVTVSPEL